MKKQPIVVITKAMYKESKKRGIDVDKDIKEGKIRVGGTKKEAINGRG